MKVELLLVILAPIIIFSFMSFMSYRDKRRKKKEEVFNNRIRRGFNENEL